MKKSKVYRTLSAFDKTHLNRLEKYLHSPYHNSNENIQKLFLAMKNHLNENPDEAFENQMVWERISQESYNEINFRKWCNDLILQIERFLGFEAFQEDELAQNRFQLLGVKNHQFKDLYTRIRRKSQVAIDRFPEESANKYVHQFWMAEILYEMDQQFFNRFEPSNIDEIIHYLDLFYSAEKLRYEVEIQDRKNFNTYQYKNRWIHLIKKALSGEVDTKAVHEIYYHIIKNHEHQGNLEYYEKLKQIIQDKVNLLSPKAAKIAFESIINYCIRHINKGEAYFLDEALFWYQEALSRDIILVNGQLSHWKYKNIVSIGLRLNAFSWIERFIEEYSPLLDENVRQNAYVNSLAQLHFYRKNFDKVLEYLREVQFDDITYNLHSKSMLLATYYELNEIEALYSLAESFRTYLNRRKNSLSDSRRQPYLRLIKFVLRLTKIGLDSQQLVKLKEDLLQSQAVFSANWIKEKIEEKLVLTI